MHFYQQDARQATRGADFRVLLLTPRYFSLMTCWGLRQWPHILAKEALSCLDRRAEFVDTTDCGHPRASLSAVSLTRFSTDLHLLQICCRSDPFSRISVMLATAHCRKQSVSNIDVVDARSGVGGNTSIACPEILYNDNSSKVCIFCGGSFWFMVCQIGDCMKSIFSLQCDGEN